MLVSYDDAAFISQADFLSSDGPMCAASCKEEHQRDIEYFVYCKKKLPAVMSNLVSPILVIFLFLFEMKVYMVLYVVTL